MYSLWVLLRRRRRPPLQSIKNQFKHPPLFLSLQPVRQVDQTVYQFCDWLLDNLYFPTGRHQFILACQKRWDKLGLARCCKRKQLQAEFWSCKWSYIRQSLLPKISDTTACIAEPQPLASQDELPEKSLPCLCLGTVEHLCGCIPHVWERKYLMKVRCQFFQQGLKEYFSLSCLFCLYSTLTENQGKQVVHMLFGAKLPPNTHLDFLHAWVPAYKNCHCLCIYASHDNLQSSFLSGSNLPEAFASATSFSFVCELHF